MATAGLDAFLARRRREATLEAVARRARRHRGRRDRCARRGVLLRSTATVRTRRQRFRWSSSAARRSTTSRDSEARGRRDRQRLELSRLSETARPRCCRAVAGEYRFGAHPAERSSASVGDRRSAGCVVGDDPRGFHRGADRGAACGGGLGSEQALQADFMSEQITVDGARTKNLEGFLLTPARVPLGDEPRHIASLFTAQFYRRAARRADASQSLARHGAAGGDGSLARRAELGQGDVPRNRPRSSTAVCACACRAQVDATIEYALPEHKERALPSRTCGSTRRTIATCAAGLPPTPIANPGLPSLLAALHPSRTEDLYYVYCGNGRHVFAKTLAEHQANVARCLQPGSNVHVFFKR